MEETAKDSTSASAKAGKSVSRLLKYPLRSASKAKEEKPPLADASNSSAPRTRGRTASSVSKSVGVLDLSGKEKSAKPPRRMSIPTKSSASPAPKLVGNITPISEARAKKSTGNQVKSDTPVSDVSKSSNRRKFNALSLASYWQSQIKVSESAAKHLISLGFFKLALEAGCEPLQLERLRNELKSYVRRHNLAEFGESVKELFGSYNILENLEQLQVSETCSYVPEEETKSSDDDVHSTSSITDIQKLKAKPSITGSAQAVVKDINKVTKKNESVTRTRRPTKTNVSNSISGSESGGGSMQKKPQKSRKQESNKNKGGVKKQENKSSNGGGPLNSSPEEKTLEENKENLTEDMSMLGV